MDRDPGMDAHRDRDRNMDDWARERDTDTDTDTDTGTDTDTDRDSWMYRERERDREIDPRNPGEGLDSFCCRRGRLARARTKQGIPWSKAWARASLKWYEHLCRHPESPAGLALACRGASWLQARRANEHAKANRSNLNFTSGPGSRLQGSPTWAGRSQGSRNQSSEPKKVVLHKPGMAVWTVIFYQCEYKFPVRVSLGKSSSSSVLIA